MKRFILMILCVILLLGVPCGYVASAEVAGRAVQVTPSVSIGYQFMIALRSDGTAVAWGNNQAGVFGNGTTVDSTTPKNVTMPVENGAVVPFSMVCAGRDHVVALSIDGRVWTWGRDAYGQLGNRVVDSTPQNLLEPKLVGGALEGKTVVSVAAGEAFSLALTSDGKVYAWGSNQFGILGNLDQEIGENYSVCYPTRVTALDEPFITAIFAGPQTVGALDSNGQAWLWGDNARRQAGASAPGANGSITIIGVPQKKTSADLYCATSISLGGYHTAILMNDGKVASVGSQRYGQLGNGKTIDENTAVFKYLQNTTVSMKMISAGSEHSVALGADGKVYIWGRNDSKVLGTGEGMDVLNTPTQVISSLWSTPVAVFAGYDNTVVIDDQGSVYAWGSNSKGEVGNNDRSEVVDAPTRVLSLNGEGGLMLGVGAEDRTYQSQITLNAIIPAPTFAISIPATVDVGSLTQKAARDEDVVKSVAFEVKATNVSNLFSEKEIVLEISSPSGSFLLMDEEFSLAYSVYDAEFGGNRLESGDVFTVFRSDGAVKGRIEIDQSQITRRGSYSGRIIFTVSVVEKEDVSE